MLRFRDVELSAASAPPASPRPAEGWPRRIGILNDYVRIPYANGSSFASQFLYRELSARGHEVTVVGPRDPAARPEELPRRAVQLASLPLRNHPGVWLPMPTPAGLAAVRRKRFDLLLGQSNSELAALGVWLRAKYRTPYLCVNTIHLPSVYDVLMPERLHGTKLVRGVFEERVIPWLERHAAEVYNLSDGLIVLSRGLASYWRERGVKVPIHVIPRAVDPRVFDQPAGADPFDPRARRGFRLLCVCRHTREKGLLRLLRIFARRIAPAVPEATLTLVGDGPDHDTFRQAAREFGVAERVFFPGEQRLTAVPNWYAHADLFVYASLSETYGQVVSEALWCGLPVVAFADDMGVSQQVEHGENGVLVQPGPELERADHRFASEVALLLRQASRRQALGRRAAELCRQRSDPDRSIERYYEAFHSAREHCHRTLSSRPVETLERLAALRRWTWVHLTTAGLGMLRPPAILNRNGEKTPSWDDFPPTPRPAPVALLPTDAVAQPAE